MRLEPAGAVYAYNADVRLDHAQVTDSSTVGSNASGGGLFVNRGEVTLIHTARLAGAAMYLPALSTPGQPIRPGA